MRLFARKPLFPVLVPLVVTMLALASCDWATYHGNLTRGGWYGGTTTVHSMSVAWNEPLDGAVYASPLVVGSMVIVATENNTLYGISASNGAVAWSRHIGAPVPLTTLASLGAPCGNINPLGITGTPAYDGVTRRVFAVAETLVAGRVVHQLVGVDPATGAQSVSAPVSPTVGNTAAHQQRGALTVAGGRVYVPYGGLAGDCGDYRGAVVSHRTDGTGGNTVYTVPTSREAGMWTPPGGTSLPNGDQLYTAGNGASTGGAYDGSDAVIELTPQLTRVRSFTPSTWPADNAADLDLGSSGPALVTSGGNDYVVQIGKRGTAYVLRRDGLALVRTASVCGSYGGAAVLNDTVYVPCSDGVRALSVAPDGTPRVVWKANGGDGQSPPGSPVIYQASVLSTNGGGGKLYALSPGNGVATASVAIGPVTRFATPALGDGRAYVGTTTGIAAVALR